MAYCTVADIEGKFQSTTFATDTTPTLVEVEEQITLKSALIDGRVYKLYETPVTGTTSLAILKDICTKLVMAEVIAIKEKFKLPSDKNVSRGAWQGFIDEAEAQLTRIERGQLMLTDAVSKKARNFVNYAQENSVEPVIKKDCNLW